MSVVEFARGFGLVVSEEAGRTLLRRDGAAVTLGVRLRLATADERHQALVACLGARLGLDLRAQGTASPSAGLARLLPASAIALAASVSGAPIASRPWHNPLFRVVTVTESGRLQLLGTTDTDTPEAVDAARRALFYETYRVRATSREELGGGAVSRWESAGGLASATTVLFPDFDLDAARDHGVLFVADYDHFYVWRPGQRRSLAQFRAFARQALQRAPMPFSRRLYHLRADRVVLGESCDGRRDFDAAELTDCLIEVT